MKIRRRIALRLAPELEPDYDAYWDEYDDDAPRLHKRALSQVLRWGGRQKPRIAGAHNYTQIIDMAPEITTLDPDESQFTTMLMRLRNSNLSMLNEAKFFWNEDKLSRRIGNFEGNWWGGFEWDDDWELESDRRAAYEARRDEAVNHFGQYVVIAGAWGEGMTLKRERAYFRAGDIVRHTGTGEAMRVTAVDEYGPTEVERL